MLLNIHPLLLGLVASALLHFHQPVPVTLSSSIVLLLLSIMPLGPNPDEGDDEHAERGHGDRHLKGAGELEHGVRGVRGPDLVGGVDSGGDAHGQGRGQADQGVHDAAGEALGLAGQGLHDVHVGDVELEVGADDVEDQGWEHEGPVVAVGAHERQEQVGDEVGQRAGGHEDRVVDAVQDVADDDVPQQARQRLREEVQRDDDGGPRADFLHEKGEVEGGGLEGHEAQDGDGHDLGDDVMETSQLVDFEGILFTGSGGQGGLLLWFTHEVEIPVLPDEGGHQWERIPCFPPDEYHQEDEPDDHETQGDGGRPAVRWAQTAAVSMRETVLKMGGHGGRDLRDTSREHASAEQSQARP